MKRILAVIITVVMLVGLSGCGKKVTIDYFEGFSYSFSGVENGSGYLNYSRNYENINYDKSNLDILNFLKSVQVKVGDNNSKLHNGDKITVSLTYSKSEAEKLGIELKETSKTYTASGFPEVWRKPADVDMEKAMSRVNAGIEEWFITGYPHEIDAYYWNYDLDNNGDPFISAVIVIGHYTDSEGKTVYRYIVECVVDYWIENYYEHLIWGEKDYGFDLDEATSAEEAEEIIRRDITIERFMP